MLVLFMPAMAFAAEETEISFKGYYKNLLMDSRTAFPQEEDFTLDLNRLRLELRGRPVEWLGFEVQYDHEAFLGSYLDTAQFRQIKSTPPATYWDLEDSYIDRGSLYARHRLYRGFVDIATPAADIRLGRQRIAWGSGRFWNPTDLLNPFNPTQLEREERTGVDAVLIEKNLGALSGLSLVHAPQSSRTRASSALRYRTNLAGTDLALLAGKFSGDRVVGFEFSGRLSETGVYGEATHAHTDVGRDFIRAVLGFEHAFPNTLTVGAEIYYNGQGMTDRTRYDFTQLFSGKTQNVARRYTGAHLKYEFTPLLRTENHFIANLDDGSIFFAPSMVYSLTADWEWVLGVQFFRGGSGSEYGRFHDLAYTSLQWFF